MITPEAWQAFGGVLAVVVALGAGVLALQRLGILRARRPAPAPGDEEKGDALAARVTALEIRCAELDERTRKHESALGGIGKVHARIDALTASTGRIEGEVGQMNGNLQLILRHMIGDRVP